jgi:hypothetical protein
VNAKKQPPTCYTATPPTEPGWYRVWDVKLRRLGYVHVDTHDSMLIVNMRTTELDLVLSVNDLPALWGPKVEVPR